MKGSDTCSTEVGGEWVGVTLTLAENCGSKFLLKRSASKRLKRSAHLESKSAILSSAEGLFIWGFTSLSTLYRSYHDG